ncbi:Polyamine oxidase [Colletotrichum sp. SAR 10_77]|nr:Polyamine oxidase [Colletotrichum sp. SAR 10_77]
MRVGIVGAGIGGLMAAITLLEGGHEVEIFEKSQFGKEVGAAISAPPNSSRILDYFGFDFSRAKATPAESLVYNNDAENLGDKTVLSLLDYKSKYGFAWHFFHRVDLHDELRKLATEPTPSHGTTVKKDLVIAADGVRSSFISTVLGEEIPSQHFMTMTRLLLPTEQMANDADTNAFFKGGYNSIRVLRVDDGSLVTYGCRNGALQNIAFMYPAEHLEDAAVNNGSKTDAHPGGFLKKYPAFIQSLASKASGIGEWRLLTRKPLDRFARGRLAVIGDAAHPMPPLRAQGASMAIEDAAALGVFLSRLTTLEDIPTRLEMFNDLRVKRAATVQLMSSQHKWDPRKIPAEYVHYFGEDIPQNDVDLERCSCDHNVIKEAFMMLQKKDEGKLTISIFKMWTPTRSLSFLFLLATSAQGAPTKEVHADIEGKCSRVQVAILGAGLAGITAAKVLDDAGIKNFTIVEYNDRIGGRVYNRAFGRQPNSDEPYFVELGANWVQGTENPAEENPILTLVKKYNLTNTPSDFSNLTVFDETGQVHPGRLSGRFKELQSLYDNATEEYQYDAGEIILQNQLDRSARAGLAIAGWKPGSEPLAQAIEWSSIDFEYANPPEKTSQQYSVVNTNTSFQRWADENNLVHDDRGFATFFKEEAKLFLDESSQLKLKTIVKNITYSSESVTVYNDDGNCITADYAICTFSLGVLQKEVVNFSPELPRWKRTAIQSMTMGTYTKIFMQFKPEDVFWDKNTQFFLYADSVQRGYYPYFQSLDHKDFVDGSGILFVTVVDQQSYVVEAQDFETTKSQIMEVLRDMFQREIPDPIDFYHHNWTREPWAYGSYSNWPPGLTLEMHQNIRANLGNLWFAGEATHPQYFGFLQGAYYEGMNAGEAVVGCIKNKEDCVRGVSYEVLNGTTTTDKYSKINGWSTKTFVKELGINIKS